MTVGDTSPEPSAPVAPKSNPFARIAGALFAPAKTFEEIARRPDVTLPLIILVILGYVSMAVIAPRVDWDAMTNAQAEQMKKKSPNATDADIQKMARIGKAIGTVGLW
ncbi:MAG: hypothetical protein QOH21_2808, partial [Acidobacteriota bacterium]|nr:hypothetical protein [Acidobacteriota bacterium]